MLHILKSSRYSNESNYKFLKHFDRAKGNFDLGPYLALEGRLLSSQSEQSEKFSKSPDWLEKADPLKSCFCVDHVNRLIQNNSYRLLGATL